MSAKNFVGIYDHALPDDLCDAIMERFEASSQKGPGVTGHGVDEAKKKSTDITITNFPEWKDLYMQVGQITYDFLSEYIREYPFLLAGAISLGIQNAQGEMETVSAERVAEVDPEQRLSLTQAVFRLGALICQKYDQNDGGYFHWHSEFFPPPNDPSLEALHRTLLFMYYLNDVDEGGETGFYYQDLKIKPKKGRMVIAPAGFTHTHCGFMPKSSDKYILTSWVLYKRREHLYGIPEGQ